MYNIDAASFSNIGMQLQYVANLGKSQTTLQGFIQKILTGVTTATQDY